VLLKHKGTSTLEWIVLAILLVSLVGGAVFTLGSTISAKLQAINVQIGS
jgi:hypothetical protein